MFTSSYHSHLLCRFCFYFQMLCIVAKETTLTIFFQLKGSCEEILALESMLTLQKSTKHLDIVKAKTGQR